MGRKKRTKSEASPNSVSEHPDKRSTMANASPLVGNSSSQVNTQPQTNIQSPSGSFLSQIPPYPGNYYASTPMSQQFTHPPVASFHQQNPNVQSTPNINQIILDKLEVMDTKLRKLDSIEKQIHDMSTKLSHMDARVTSLETKSHESSRKISEIEASRHFDSQSCDEIKNKQSELDKVIKAEKLRSEQLSKNVDSLKQENRRLSDDMIDMQSRSMRDNLLFFNFEELQLADDRKNEDCTKTVYEFCENTLQMNDVKSTVKIDRAHRVGSYTSGKTRPIVAKFNFYQDKMQIKRNVHEKRESTGIRVSDQYPKAIQERRKTLIPELIRAKNDGKNAVLNYDKLFIEGRRFVPPNPSD